MLEEKIVSNCSVLCTITHTHEQFLNTYAGLGFLHVCSVVLRGFC